MSLTIEAETLSLPARAPVAGSAAGPRYDYRRLATAELPLVNDLYNDCYRYDRPLADAVWLYRKNPNGAAVIYGAFDERGELAGTHVAIPWKLYWRGEERTAWELADALVASRHRNRGIFTRLVRLTCEQAEQEQCTLYTIPNSESLPGYRRSRHLQVLGATETRVKAISWPQYLAQRMGVTGDDDADVPAEPWEAGAVDGSVSLVPIDRFECDFEAIHVELARIIASFTLRDRDYLQWRYFGSPARCYRVALVKQHGRVRGYVVMRMIGRVAHLIDVFLPPDVPLASQAFRLAADWAARMGAIAVHFKASKGNFLNAAAARCGFWLRKRSGSLVMDRKSGQLLESRQHGPLGTPDAYFVMGDFNFY